MQASKQIFYIWFHNIFTLFTILTLILKSVLFSIRMALNSLWIFIFFISWNHLGTPCSELSSPWGVLAPTLELVVLVCNSLELAQKLLWHYSVRKWSLERNLYLDFIYAEHYSKVTTRHCSLESGNKYFYEFVHCCSYNLKPFTRSATVDLSLDD